MADCRLCFELYSTSAIAGSRDNSRSPLQINLFTRQIVLPANAMETKQLGVIKSEPFDPTIEWDPAELFKSKRGITEVDVDGEHYYVAGEMRIPDGAFHNPGSYEMGCLELRVYIERDTDSGERVWELPPKYLDYDIVINSKRLHTKEQKLLRDDFNRCVPSSRVGWSGWVFALMGWETIGFVESEKRRSSGTDTTHSVQRMGGLGRRERPAGTDCWDGYPDWIRLYPAIERSKLPLLRMQMRPLV